MDPDEKFQAEQTLLVLDGVLEVQERREEFFLIIEEAQDIVEARRRLQEHFGFEDFACHAVLDVQVPLDGGSTPHFRGPG